MGRFNDKQWSCVQWSRNVPEGYRKKKIAKE